MTAALRSVLVPGNLDGVHRGHRALLQVARRLAAPKGLRVVALFFFPHPAHLLRPAQAGPPLTTAARRVELLRAAGAEEVAVERFDATLAASEPEAFVAEVLQRRWGVEHLVCGPDFRFGRDRAGDAALLERLLGADRVHVQAALREGERPVSSSWVREALAAGDVALATRLLGRFPEVEGRVVAGERRARRLGFPTANLRTEPVLRPADGVYAAWVRLLDRAEASVRPAAVALGARPTFEGSPPTFEVHLPGFDGDLYGERLRVAFVARLRAQRRFDGEEALREAMAADVREALRRLQQASEDAGRWV